LEERKRVCKNQYLLDKKYRVVFFDFGDTLVFNNQPFVEGLYKILKTMEINTNINKLKAAVRMANIVLEDERCNAKSETKYCAFEIKYYGYVLELLGYLQKDNQYPEYIHNMMPYYHKTYLKPEVPLVLSTLKEEGYKLGIISNNNYSFLQICDELGIRDKFDFIIYSDDVGCEKPLPHIFEDALLKADVKPQESIHVGDSYMADVLGARRVGITPILVCNENIENIYDDCICINNLIDILKFLEIEFNRFSETPWQKCKG